MGKFSNKANAPNVKSICKSMPEVLSFSNKTLFNPKAEVKQQDHRMPCLCKCFSRWAHLVIVGSKVRIFGGRIACFKNDR